jgi:biotin transport system substrate-specific component
MQSNLRMLLLASLMATLTAVGAVIRIPMFPVPITLQTFFVLLAGGLLGPIWGGISMLIYLTLGLVGLPVFAGGSGIGIVLSPTFGYLLGFPFAAYYIGKKFEGASNMSVQKNFRKKHLVHLVFGSLIIYVFGLFYLWIIKNLYVGDAFPVSQTFVVGFLVFIPGLLLKSVFANFVIFRLKSQLNLFLVI